MAGNTYRGRMEIANMSHMNINTEWAKTLHNALKKEVEIVPRGFLTNKEVAKELGVLATRATKLLRELKNRKLIEVQNFRVIVDAESGLIRNVPHYRLKKSTCA